MKTLAIIPPSWSPVILSVLRIVVGLTFMEHGTGKLLNFPVIPGIADMMTHGMILFTGTMELVGGALIVLGLFTRPVAFILSGYMATAYFLAHFPASVFPMLNQGEPAILYCFAFLFFAAAGPGRLALDRD